MKRSWGAVGGVAVAVAACAAEPKPAPVVAAPIGSIAAPIAGESAAPLASESAVPFASASASASAIASDGPIEPPPPLPEDDERNCAPVDRGMGPYAPYVDVGSISAVGGRWKSRLTVPTRGRKPADGVWDVVFHFHFHDAARRVFVWEDTGMAFGGLDLGDGSKVYSDFFKDADAFPSLLKDIDAALKKATGDENARHGKIYLSSWSAGFGATMKILRAHPDDVAGVILLDSLYAANNVDAQGAPIEHTVMPEPMEPMVAFGKRAKKGEKFVFLSYSQVPTTGYASTGDVGAYLLEKLHLNAAFKVNNLAHTGPWKLIGHADAGSFHLSSHLGKDEMAHCRHFRLLKVAADAIRDAKSPW